MKIRYSLFLLLLFVSSGLLATDHVISTVGTSYSPATIDAVVGDNITIEASNSHPTVEVSEATWDMNGTTELLDGFGTHTSSVTFTVEEVGTIFYVCTSHVTNFGMKGQINVGAVGLDEYIYDIRVEFGTMPITDGQLDYTISAPENVVKTIEIVGLNGQQVIVAEVMSAEGRLDINARPGVYIVLLKDADGNMVFRESISLR